MSSKLKNADAAPHAYVRVQDDLHGLTTDPTGRVLLARAPGSSRNTIHFAVDGLVSDHAYGKFNEHSDGTLKGKIVIVADPGDLPAPAGLNQVDTWFRLGASARDTGEINRHLDVGHATLVVPQGISVPADARYVVYDGTIEGRNAAVSQVLADRGVQEQRVEFRNWRGFSESQAITWAQETAKHLYSERHGHIHIGMHDASLDGGLETVGIAEKLRSFEKAASPLFVNDHGVSIAFMDDINAKLDRDSMLIEQFFQVASPDDVERCGLFYTQLRASLAESLIDAIAVSARINSLEARRIQALCDLEDKLHQLAPRGKVYIATSDGAVVESLNITELAERLTAKRLPASSQVWIAGHESTWQPVTLSPLKEFLLESGDLECPPPLRPIMLEPIRRNGYPQPDRAFAEEAVASAVESDPLRFIDAYVNDDRALGGRYIAADLFKETFPEYRTSKESRNRYNNPLHNSAAVLSAELFRQRLASTGEPQQDTVLFLTGIPGAGKTSSVLAGGQLPEHVRCVFEGQMSNPVTTFEKIQQALDAGLKPVIIAVHARPEDALQNTFRRFKEHGRGASISVMANIQGGLPSSLAAVHARFGDQVALQVNDYRDRKNPVVLKGWAHLSVLESEGNHDKIKSRLSSALRLHAAAGTIPDECYRQASGQPPADIEPSDDELERVGDLQHATDVG